LQRLDLQSQADWTIFLLGRMLGRPPADDQAPTREAWEKELAQEADAERRGSEPQERNMDEESEKQQGAPAGDVPREVLVVVSKLKGYIKARSGMNTSDGVVPVLSDEIRRLCDRAIENASRDGRKTVMDRDFSGPPRD
jgi:hypothetical protein